VDRTGASNDVLDDAHAFGGQWDLDSSRRVTGLLRQRPLVMSAVAAAAAVSGLIEALLLVLVVRVAGLAVDDNASLGSVSFGPFDLQGLDGRSAFVLGGVGVAAFAIVQAGVAGAEARLSASLLVSTRQQLVTGWMRTDWPTKSSEPPGDLIALMGEFSGRVKESLVLGLAAFVAGISFLALVASAFVVSPIAALSIAVIGGLIGLLLNPLTRLSRRYGKNLGNESAAFITEANRMIMVAREIVAFDVGDRVAQLVNRQAERVATWQRRSQFAIRIVPTLYRTIVLGLLFAGLGLVYLLELGDIGSLAAIVLILLRALNYTQQAQAQLQRLADVEPYVGRVADKIAEFRDHRLVRDGREIDEIRTVSLHDVGFHYILDEPVLSGLDLELTLGDALGVVGASGAGKSTLVDVLLRLREPTHGHVVVNGIDARTVERGSWHRRLAFVSQHPGLTTGTLVDNVMFHRDGIDRARAIAALKEAQLQDFLRRHGPDAPVGESGSLLSGGQAQRVGIARAVAGVPDLLVLDEPTSALDVLSEARMVEMLRQVRERRIIVVISHRPAALEVCNKILVLHPGARHELIESADDIADRTAFLRDMIAMADDDEDPADDEESP